MPRLRDEIEQRVTEEVFREWMDETVGECDVCHGLLSRAEIHLMDKQPGGFGCFIGCNRRMGNANPK